MTSTIPIGILHSQGGPMALPERMLIDGALMAVDEINERGGLLGREVRACIGEGLSEADAFGEEAKRLIRDKEVCSLFGCWTSSSRKIVKAVVEEEGSLLWYPVQYEGLEQSPNIVYSGSCMNQQIAPAVNWAVSTGKRRIALVGSDYVFPRTANKLIASMLPATDAGVVHESYHPLNCEDFSSLWPALEESQPDLIISTINGISNMPFLEQLHDFSVQSRPYLVCSLSCCEILCSKLSRGCEGQLACWGYFQSLDTAANQHFLNKLKKNGVLIACDPLATAYSQIMLWASVVERIGSCETENVLANLVGSVIDSPLGRLEIQANHHVLRNAYIGQYNGGQFDILWQSDGPITPLPWFGVSQTELPFKNLILEVLGQLPEDVTMQARLNAEVEMRRDLADAMSKNQRRLEETESIARVGGFERCLKTGEGYWSDTLFDLLGYSPGSFVPSLEMFAQHVIEEDRDGIHKAFNSAIMEALDFDQQFRIRRADGERRYVMIHCVTLKDEQGRPDRYHGTVMDITERALAEDALRAKEEEMRLLAQTDALTGIFNRRRFLELAEMELKRVARYPSPFTLIMFDIDKFKTVNDTYGHAVGDKVLKAVTDCARTVARTVDFLGRLGGEEFAVALPQTDLAGALIVAERLRKAVEDCGIVVNDVTLRTTISLGVAESMGCAVDIDTILNGADIALYRAKENGRNRVEVMVQDDLDDACEVSGEE